MRHAAVYVPTGREVALAVKLGSALVGSLETVDAAPQQRVTIDYEGNLYGSSALTTWADRALHAWDRQQTRYPTIARASFQRGDLLHVGWWTDDGIELAFAEHDMQLLLDWLLLRDASELQAECRRSGWKAVAP